MTASPRRARRRIGAALAVTGFTVGLVALPPASRGAALPPVTPVAAAEPTVQIVAISPRLPIASSKDRRVRFTVVVTAGTTALSGAELRLHRGNPLVTEQSLADAVTAPPATDDVVIPAVPLTATLAARHSRTVVLAATADNVDADGTQGLCLTCQDGVYPVDVTLSHTESGTELARAHALVPSFLKAPRPVRVSWVWPLLDRPHRGASATVFDDDELATSVSANGRLDRALRVAELVANRVRLTLLIDPELVDALTVMSTRYDVRTANGVRPGTRAEAARNWLRRLAVVVRSEDVVRTAYADPDVDTLARNGISWSTALDAHVSDSVHAALGVDPGAQLSWPAGETLGSQGLDSVLSNGASAVLLSDHALPGALHDAQTPDALAPLPSASGNATALVLSSALQSTADAVTTRGAGVADTATRTQYLLAQLAVRAAQDPPRAHYVVLAPSRYVDTDPGRTATVMTAIATAPFAADLSVTAALQSVASVGHGALAATAGGGLNGATLALLSDTRTRLGAFRACLSNDDASTLLSAYPPAISRGESSYWRTHAVEGQAFAGRLRIGIAALMSQVHITSPDNALYTLASSDAPLFVTVGNSLPVKVRMGLRVDAAPGERGLVTRPVAVQDIPPGIHQFKVSTRVERTGKFKVLLTLVSPSGQTFGASSQIRVKSTAFGAVALWITGVAFGVLILALAIRTVRRIRHRTPRPPREALATPTGAIS